MIFVFLFPLLDDGFPGDDVTFSSDINVSPGFRLSCLLPEILATVSASFNCVVPSAHIQRKKMSVRMVYVAMVVVACLTGSTIKMLCYQGKLLHDLTLNKKEKVKTHEYIKHPLIQILNICFLTGILSHENFAFDSNA